LDKTHLLPVLELLRFGEYSGFGVWPKCGKGTFKVIDMEIYKK
jgi:hypothetical protein